MSQRLRRERTANQPRRAWLIVAWVLLGSLAFVICVGIFGLLLVLRTAPPPVIHIDPFAADRLRQELQAAETTAGKGPTKVVGADEIELNSLLQEYLHSNTGGRPADSVPVLRDMKLNLADDRIRLYVLTNIRGKDISVSLEGKLHALNGYLDFEPISGEIGSLPIPKRSLRRTLEQMLATAQGRQYLRLPSDVQDLHIENGRLVVIFK
jgi:hypothetical protein